MIPGATRPTILTKNSRHEMAENDQMILITCNKIKTSPHRSPATASISRPKLQNKKVNVFNCAKRAALGLLAGLKRLRVNLRK